MGFSESLISIRKRKTVLILVKMIPNFNPICKKQKIEIIVM